MIVGLGLTIGLSTVAKTNQSPNQRRLGYPPDVSHLRTFGCAVYVPIPPPNRSKMGPQRRLGIYIGFISASIILFLEPTNGDSHQAKFSDCRFHETFFPNLGAVQSLTQLDKNFQFPQIGSITDVHDPPTEMRHSEVRRIILLHDAANTRPESFSELPHNLFMPATKLPQPISTNGALARESRARLKRGCPFGSKQSKKRMAPSEPETSDNVTSSSTTLPNVAPPRMDQPEPILTADNLDIATHHSISDGTIVSCWNRKEIIIDDLLCHHVATTLTQQNEIEDCINANPKSFTEALLSPQNAHWKAAIKAELQSLMHRNTFNMPSEAPPGRSIVGCKWFFVKKRGAAGRVQRFKARLVAKGFTQRFGIDYQETYAPVIDSIAYRYLIGLTMSSNLKMHIYDVVTAYLYGHLSEEIYMEVPEGLETMHKVDRKLRNPAVKLNRAIYGLKQAGHVWYNLLSQFLIQSGFPNNDLCPCVFIRKDHRGPCIIALYVDDLNIIGSQEAIKEIGTALQHRFEVKHLGETKFCLGVQIDHVTGGVLYHQRSYIRTVLKKFNMDNAHPASTPLTVRRLDPERDEYSPRRQGEAILPPEIPYVAAIGALMYLANTTRPDISFAVNLLARYSHEPVRRHWSGLKMIMRYLRGTEDMGLFYQRPRTQSHVQGMQGCGPHSQSTDSKIAREAKLEHGHAMSKTNNDHTPKNVLANTIETTDCTSATESENTHNLPVVLTKIRKMGYGPNFKTEINRTSKTTLDEIKERKDRESHYIKNTNQNKPEGIASTKQTEPLLIGYADAGYLSDLSKGRSQTGYCFLSAGAAISWRSTKQTIAATSSNHAEILALHEASRECVWLR
jgi:hypothetical protein